MPQKDKSPLTRMVVPRADGRGYVEVIDLYSAFIKNKIAAVCEDGKITRYIKEKDAQSA